MVTANHRNKPLLLGLGDINPNNNGPLGILFRHPEVFAFVDNRFYDHNEGVIL